MAIRSSGDFVVDYLRLNIDYFSVGSVSSVAVLKKQSQFLLIRDIRSAITRVHSSSGAWVRRNKKAKLPPESGFRQPEAVWYILVLVVGSIVLVADWRLSTN